MPLPIAVLVYDAHCPVCRHLVDLGRRYLTWMPPAVGFQHVDLTPLGISREQAEQAVQLCGYGERPRHGADAVAAIVRRQPQPAWRLIGHLMEHPPVRWLAAGVYHLVSRHRSRIARVLHWS